MLPNATGLFRLNIKEGLMQRALPFAAAALALTVGFADAQEARDSAKTLLQNERVRVMEVNFKPGAKTSEVSQPNRFLYALTDGSLVFVPPGKTPYELSFKAGEAIWLPSQQMSTENDSGKEVKALVVEFKDGGSRSAAAAAAGAGKPKAAKGARGKGKAGRGGRGKRRG
jgi:quercetin dioxygenase-like cupin family protein